MSCTPLGQEANEEEGGAGSGDGEAAGRHPRARGRAGERRGTRQPTQGGTTAEDQRQVHFFFHHFSSQVDRIHAFRTMRSMTNLILLRTVAVMVL